MPSALLPLAPGFEDLEAVTVIDLLRRAGIEVTVAGLAAGTVTGSRGTTILPDTTLEQARAHEHDLLVLPGGEPGATNLQHDTRIRELVQRQHATGKLLAAVCAAPRVLAAAGVLNGKRACCYPGTIDTTRYPGIELVELPVVTDGTITTSRGPGTVMDFALELIERLAGKPKRDDVEAHLLRAEAAYLKS